MASETEVFKKHIERLRKVSIRNFSIINYNRGQDSWDSFPLAILGAQAKQTVARDNYRCHALLPPHPQCCRNMHTKYFQTINIVLGGGRGNCYGVLKFGAAFGSNSEIIDSYESVCMTVPKSFASIVEGTCRLSLCADDH